MRRTWLFHPKQRVGIFSVTSGTVLYKPCNSFIALNMLTNMNTNNERMIVLKTFTGLPCYKITSLNTIVSIIYLLYSLKVRNKQCLLKCYYAIKVFILIICIIIQYYYNSMHIKYPSIMNAAYWHNTDYINYKHLIPKQQDLC